MSNTLANLSIGTAGITSLVKKNSEFLESFSKVAKAERIESKMLARKTARDKRIAADEFFDKLNKGLFNKFGELQKAKKTPKKSPAKKTKEPSPAETKQQQTAVSSAQNSTHKISSTMSSMFQTQNSQYDQQERHHKEKHAMAKLLNVFQVQQAYTAFKASRRESALAKRFRHGMTHMSHQNWVATTQITKELVRIHSVLVGDNSSQAHQRQERMGVERSSGLVREARLDNEFERINSQRTGLMNTKSQLVEGSLTDWNKEVERIKQQTTNKNRSAKEQSILDGDEQLKLIRYISSSRMRSDIDINPMTNMSGRWDSINKSKMKEGGTLGYGSGLMSGGSGMFYGGPPRHPAGAKDQAGKSIGGQFKSWTGNASTNNIFENSGTNDCCLYLKSISKDTNKLVRFAQADDKRDMYNKRRSRENRLDGLAGIGGGKGVISKGKNGLLGKSGKKGPDWASLATDTAITLTAWEMFKKGGKHAWKWLGVLARNPVGKSTLIGLGLWGLWEAGEYAFNSSSDTSDTTSPDSIIKGNLIKNPNSKINGQNVALTNQNDKIEESYYKKALTPGSIYTNDMHTTKRLDKMIGIMTVGSASVTADTNGNLYGTGPFSGGSMTSALNRDGDGGFAFSHKGKTISHTAGSNGVWVSQGANQGSKLVPNNTMMSEKWNYDPGQGGRWGLEDSTGRSTWQNWEPDSVKKKRKAKEKRNKAKQKKDGVPQWIIDDADEFGLEDPEKGNTSEMIAAKLAYIGINKMSKTNWFNKGMVPGESKWSLGKHWRNEKSLLTYSNAAFANGQTGISHARPLNAFTPQQFRTGPSATFRVASKFAGRMLPGVGAGLAAYDANARLQSGDNLGAALSVGSGVPVLGLVPLAVQVLTDYLGYTGTSNKLTPSSLLNESSTNKAPTIINNTTHNNSSSSFSSASTAHAPVTPAGMNFSAM